MAEWQSDMYGQYKLDAVARAPKLDHCAQVCTLVTPILRYPVFHPNTGVPAASSNKLLNGIVCWEIYDRKVNGDIKQDHLKRIFHTSSVFQLLCKAKHGKLVHGRKPLPEFVHHKPVLETTKVGSTEHNKDEVSLPVYLRP